ncbi:hypothetical protein AEQ67_18210 [Pseudomonas sp. RIT-PI-q]|uniref:DUF485 domain-containing protein n=1 Tax=Pseudomonas sp. RIT-PI-q TaxID=1690247 RepID=UPI0006CD2C77|nr:DUF485 domain-containing protein [Pseudomonas sp. RIT-PI-q]KPG95891.1 hypothetical protein AEQ67_18210 [Pseudomonas sp. RIT-PI-q]
MKKRIVVADQSREYVIANIRKKHLSLWFAAVNIVIFITFIGIFNFGQSLLATLISPGVTWGVIVEPSLIVLALIMSLVYYICVERLERDLKEGSL